MYCEISPEDFKKSEKIFNALSLLEHHNQLNKNGMTSRPTDTLHNTIRQTTFSYQQRHTGFTGALTVFQWIRINLCEQFYLQS